MNQISSGPSRGVCTDLENRRPVSENYKAGRSRSPSGLREFADYVVTGNLLGLKHRKQRGSATGERG